jgi:hypothetical protein
MWNPSEFDGVPDAIAAAHREEIHAGRLRSSAGQLPHPVTGAHRWYRPHRRSEMIDPRARR